MCIRDRKKPLLPDSAAIIIDEAHKLPETARQMFGVTLNAQDFAELIQMCIRDSGSTI